MLESQKIHEQEKASLCPAAPLRRWGIYQTPWAFCDRYLLLELVVLESPPSLHMGPMEKKVWNQQILVRKPEGTEAGRMSLMEVEEEVVGIHLQKAPKLVSLAAVA